MKKFLTCALFASAIIITSCTDGSIIGTDLLGDEEISLQFDESFELTGQTVLGDSLPTYILGNTNQTYLLGEIDEPVFGKYSSDIYTAFRFSSTFPNYDNAVLDSIVLDLEYDEDGFYGDTTVLHNIEVFRLSDEFIDSDTIYSNQTFMTDMTPLASVALVPSKSENINTLLRELDSDSIVSLSPRLRIRLDDAFGMELLEDDEAESNDSIFNENYKGLYIKSTTEGSSMIGLNFNENPDFNDGIARLHLYYTVTNDSTGEVSLSQYSYVMSAVTSSEFIHDYDGSTVGASLNNSIAGQEFLYSHNMAGVNAEIEIPDLNFLDNNNSDTIIINAAQLVLTVSEDIDDFQTDLYPHSPQFLLSKDNEDGGKRILIDDIVKDGISLTLGLEIHDGAVREVTQPDGSTIKTVTFVITNYVQNLLEDDITSSKVTISALGRSESPRRTVFYGLNHPEFPAKLRIAYTKI
jgi:hypothetical protein